jgi:hypothetical protein
MLAEFGDATLADFRQSMWRTIRIPATGINVRGLSSRRRESRMRTLDEGPER